MNIREKKRETIFRVGMSSMPKLRCISTCQQGRKKHVVLWRNQNNWRNTSRAISGVQCNCTQSEEPFKIISLAMAKVINCLLNVPIPGTLKVT